MKDLGLDSLDAVEVVMAFEDEFGEQSVIASYSTWNLVCGFIWCYPDCNLEPL